MTISDKLIGTTNLKVAPDSITPGANGTASAIYKVSQNDIDAGRVINTAKITGFTKNGESVEDVSGTNVENDDPTVTPIIQTPSIRIEKEAVLFSEKALVNEEVNFNIKVTNTGNVTLYDVLVKDSLTGFEQEITQLVLGESLSFTTSYIVQVTDETAGRFDNEATVTATTFNGAVMNASSSVTVPVEQCELVIPTGFSPNDDGIADTWRIKCLEKYPDAYIEIYNRWGNRVFEKNNFGNSDVHGASDEWWNGYSSQKWTFGNDRLPTGTYFYILDLKDGSKPLSGYLFLNR